MVHATYTPWITLKVRIVWENLYTAELHSSESHIMQYKYVLFVIGEYMENIKKYWILNKEVSVFVSFVDKN